MPTTPTLTYDALKAAVTGGAAALRLTLKLEAVSPKVFPPTYEGGKYATEDRVIDKVKVPCVLLDSVPSQANRMEAALQDACDGGEIKLPVVTVDFAAVKNPGVPKITSLQAPHRIVDAILRDSKTAEGTAFRKSKIGLELDQLGGTYATPLLTYAPHCLVFGMWDSTGPRGGLGVKFARALVSEIIGVNAIPGVTTSSRLDPLAIMTAAGPLYKTKDNGWTLDAELAEKDPKTKKPLPIGKKGGKPSEANHGNVTPDLVFRKDKNGNPVMGDNERPVMMVILEGDSERSGKYVIRDERQPIAKGGFTIDYAEQVTVLSLPALRRLRFPATVAGKSTPAGDAAARTYLAALALLGATLALESGYDLRSRCLLRATDAVTWQLLGRPGDADQSFALDKPAALKLYADALAAVLAAKLPVHLDEVTLTPSAELVGLVKKSMELAAAGVVDTGEES